MEPVGMGRRVVVIDEDEATRLRMSWDLSRAGYRVEVYEDGVQGIEGATRSRPDVVLVALRLEGLTGIDVISCLRNTLPGKAIIGMTAYPTAALEATAMQAGAYTLLAKPVTAELLTATVNQVLSERLAAKRSG